MKRVIAAVLLAGLAGVSFAQETAKPVGVLVTVHEGEKAPAGFGLLVPNYEWQDGRFVQNGNVFKSLYGDR